MAIVAKKVKDNKMKNKSIQEWFDELDKDPKTLKRDSRAALIDIADGNTLTEKTNNS
ncbi:MAG: hypothetical protein PHP14_00470 [Candidatus Pacebacteria bacterium]|nr:hypothetical protein [Candidatus Paceibacterota bacterium]MDD3808574.1 hypothetical protein [Candidatus Paceibacterota bacterium]